MLILIAKQYHEPYERQKKINLDYVNSGVSYRYKVWAGGGGLRKNSEAVKCKVILLPLFP